MITQPILEPSSYGTFLGRRKGRFKFPQAKEGLECGDGSPTS